MNNLTRIFKALADPTRLGMLRALGTQTLCVGALAHRLGVTHSAVSQHLRILREAGLVEGNRRGYWVHYSLDRREVRKIQERIGKWLEGLSAVPASECTDTRKCPRPDESRLGKFAARR